MWVLRMLKIQHLRVFIKALLIDRASISCF